MTVRIAVLTVSDRCSCGDATDTAGPAVAERARRALGGSVIATACAPDERDEIARIIRDWATRHHAPDLILTTGGTGLAPRDVTPEATLDVIERRCPGLVEFIRARCGEQHPRAYLSRAEAGTIQRTLVVNLPGSLRGAVESFDALVEILPHALGVLGGTVRDCAPRSTATEDAR